MTNTKQLLAVRAKSNARKPRFVVKESNFVTRIKVRWRNMHGRHSKVRQMHNGRPALPTPGYGAPAAVRGFHKSGLMPIMVATERELLAIKPATQGAVLASKLGARKRLGLVTLAQQKNIPLLNVKSAAGTVEKIKSDMTSRRNARASRFTTKSKKDEEKRRKADEKKADEKAAKKAAKESADATVASGAQE